MSDVPPQPPDPRSRASARAEPEGRVIPMTPSGMASPPPVKALPAKAPPPPVWGGMASAPPPTRDFRGPFAFVALLAVVALVAIGLLVYAASMERRAELEAFSVEGATTSSPGGAQGPEPTPGAGTALLRISGDPAGATVRVDLDSIGVLPATLGGLSAGDYLVTIEAGDRVLDTLVTVADDDVTLLLVSLGAPSEPTAAAVEIRPEPEPARPAPEPARSAPESPRRVATAPATGTLRVTSRPSGASVSLDGVGVGTTPLALPDVSAGTHSVRVALAGYQPRTLDVAVRPGRDQTARVALDVISGPGTLEVLARPWGTITIDGTVHKRNTDVVYRAELPAGTHTIRVDHPTFGSQTRRVTVETGGSTMEVFDLTLGTSEDGDR